LKRQRGVMGGLRAAAGVLLVLLPCIAIVLIGSNLKHQALELLSRAHKASHTSSLSDNKVTWQTLRPEHSAYYPSKIRLFTGKESSLYGRHREILSMRSILQNGPSASHVETFSSLRVAALRSVAWDKGAHVMVFPSFADYPDLHMISKTDIRGYASTGNNVVFLGGFGTLDVMNEIFGWQLKPVTYQEGPFYRSERNAHNTVMATMPSLVQSDGGGTFGVRIKSLPPSARSYYDSLGDTVLFAVRYDLGMVTYVGSDMGPTGNADWHKLLRAAISL